MKKQIPVPLQNKVLICPTDEAINKGGKAFIPETETRDERKKSSQGKVVALGSEYLGELKKGDDIFFDKFSGEYFVINNVEYYAVLPESVYVVLR